MGSPPKYEQVASDDVYDHVGDVEAGLTNSTAEGADSVIYTYAPLFPRKGKTEHIVGLRGKSRQETIAMVHRYFPSLTSMSSDRLAFEVPVPATLPQVGQRVNNPNACHAEEWATVKDEAWAGFERSAPSRIRVVVVDTPKDVRRRNCRTAFAISAAVLGPILFMFFFIIFMMICATDF